MKYPILVSIAVVLFLAGCQDNVCKQPIPGDLDGDGAACTSADFAEWLSACDTRSN